MYYASSRLGTLDEALDDLPVLISAGAAWRNPNGDQEFTVGLPEASSLMIDSGGFQAATRWNGAEAGERGLPGRYPYSPTELHDWAESINADVVAGMDIACEDANELFDGSEGFEKGYVWPGDYRDRLLDSLDYQIRQERVYRSGGYSHDFMPVIQGREIEDYEDFIDLFRTSRLTEYDQIAIGTVCKRSSTDEIHKVARLVRDHFPEKHIHLFGATLTVYKDQRFRELFDSSDTAAWNWGASNKAEEKEKLAAYREKVDKYASDLAEQSSL